MRAFEITLRVFAALAGFVFFYVAWFAYETEERRIQNTLEDWWIQLEEFRASALVRGAGLPRFIAAKTSVLMDRVFGPRLLSAQSLAVCTSFCVGAYFFHLGVDDGFRFVLGTPFPRAVLFLIGSVGLAAAVIPAFRPRLRLLPHLILWPTIVLVSTLPGQLGVIVSHPFAGFGIWGFGAIAAIGLTTASLYLAVILSRLALRHAPRLPVAKATALALAMPIVLAVVMVVPMAIFGLLATIVGVLTLGGVILPVRSSMMIVLACTLVMLTYVLLLALMVLHQPLWPVVSRVLYALQRYELPKKKKSLNSLAVIALSAAFGPTSTWAAVAVFTQKLFS